MNVLVIGSGGREHAICWKIKQSPLCEDLFVLPGNGGTREIAKNISLKISDQKEILNFCRENKIDLCVIGPEQPLVDGLADFLRQNNVNVFGPNKNAARIESEKAFAKDLMLKYDIPTAAYKEFHSSQIKEAIDFLSNQIYPLVIKANGLAAGKGVVICNDFNEANQTIENFFIHKIFGSSGDKLIIEEFLTGEEASIFAVTDGKEYVILPASQDHKRIGDGDTGKNTGGMGAYAPTPVVTDYILNQVEGKIIKPIIQAMQKEECPFSGCLYCGLMITSEGPKVIEFNCRFGDPETQAVLPILEGDLLELLYSSAIGKINKSAVKYSGGSAVCVVTASKGYPDNYETGFEIKGLNDSENVVIFHAGTKSIGENVITNGGRVLGVCSYLSENNIASAIEIAYKKIENIFYDNIYFRKDIAARAIKK